jgi:Kef-type K+ transport system membrane component KefB
VDNIFVQFAIILSISSLLGLVALKFKLPLVVSYLLAGVALSLLSVFDTSGSLVLHILPEIGIAFVLFLIGMELDLREIKSLGVPIVSAALIQILITTFVGFFVTSALGFGIKEGILLSLGLAFSSTVVVVKILTERQDSSSLYGKLAIGILLVEDLVAVAVLMAISVGSSAFNVGLQENLPMLTLVLKGVGLFVLAFVLSKYALKKIFDIVAKSTELLFFTSITWCFVFTSLSVLAGFSIEIGAFLAGIALASSPYHFQIQGKIKPLRDFFITLFFIYLGSQIKVQYLYQGLPIILIFTALALVLKPIVYMFVMGLFGFKKHTIFQTAISLSQISEFSLIVLVVGANFAGVSVATISIMAAVAVVSIIASSILISNSRKIYSFLLPIMHIFERKGEKHFLDTQPVGEMEGHVIIIGAHRVGGPLAEYLKREGVPFLIMDFNPHLVNKLRDEGMNVIYGDIGDPEVLDSLQIEKTKLIISTAPSLGDNEILLSECKRRKTDAIIIVRAEDRVHGEALKTLGADYIMSPERVTGSYLVKQIKDHWPKVSFPGLD